MNAHRTVWRADGGKRTARTISASHWPAFAVMSAVLFCPALACAQDTAPAPALARQIRIVVASLPGTGPDYLARLISPALGEALRANVVVENRAGSNAIVGTVYVARGPADGSVVLMGNAGSHAVNAALYKKLPYDPLLDFAPVSELAAVGLALIVHPSVPAKTLRELITLAKREPGKLNVAVAGATGELMGNALMLQAKINMKHIPYKGGPQGVIAVMSGEADMVFTTPFIVLEQVKAGKLKVLAVASSTPSPLTPDVPTAAASGLPGYEVENWQGLLVPTGTPQAIINKLHGETVRILQTVDAKERLYNQGFEVGTNTPQQFAAYLKVDIQKWAKLVKSSGASVD